MRIRQYYSCIWMLLMNVVIEFIQVQSHADRAFVNALLNASYFDRTWFSLAASLSDVVRIVYTWCDVHVNDDNDNYDAHSVYRSCHLCYAFRAYCAQQFHAMENTSPENQLSKVLRTHSTLLLLSHFVSPLADFCHELSIRGNGFLTWMWHAFTWNWQITEFLFAEPTSAYSTISLSLFPHSATKFVRRV